MDEITKSIKEIEELKIRRKEIFYTIYYIDKKIKELEQFLESNK